MSVMPQTMEIDLVNKSRYFVWEYKGRQRKNPQRGVYFANFILKIATS